MKYKLPFLTLLLTVILSGCAASKETGTETSPTPSQQAVTSAPTLETKPPTSPEPAKLSDSEELAMAYVNVYLNGSDLDAKKKFVDDSVHPDSQKALRILESVETPAENKLLNPEVMQTVDYESGGKNVTAALIKGKKNGSETEIIILMADGKVGWGFMKSDDDPNVQKKFTEMRARFK